MQDADGQIALTHSVSAGLDYASIGPEHALLRDLGRTEYTYATDDEALAGFKLLCEMEGIIPALESAHAIAHLTKLAPQMGRDEVILVNVSGRGDKDLDTVMKAGWTWLIEAMNPTNDLPLLPPSPAIETDTACCDAALPPVRLAELKGAANLIPNQSILINSIPLEEARRSSEIENIVTTQDALFSRAIEEPRPNRPADQGSVALSNSTPAWL